MVRIAKLTGLPRTELVSLGLFIIWCATNALYAADAHKLLHDSSLKHLYVDLTLVQIVVSVLLVYPFVPPPYPSITETQMSLRGISACHFTGALLTNASYAILGATSTLVWKLSEPFATMIFKLFIQKEKVPALSFAGIVIVVSGVIIFSGFNARNSFMFSPIVLANIAFPLRNVLMKLNQRKESNSKMYCPERAFLAMQVHAFPFALIVFLIKWFVYPAVPLPTLIRLARNAMYFFSYQMASIALLARLDSLAHAVANLFKRFSSIIASAIFVHSEILPRHLAGLSLTVIGFPLYALAGFAESHAKFRSILVGARQRGSLILMLTVVFLAGFTSRPIMEELRERAPIKATKLLNNFRGDGKPVDLRSKMKKPVLRTRIKLFPDDGVERGLTTIKKVEAPSRYPLFLQTFDFKVDNMRDDNYGNNVWLHAALRVLPDLSEKRVCYSRLRTICTALEPKLCNTSISKCQKNQPDPAKRTSLMFYYPTANAFDKLNVRQFGTEANNLRKYGDLVLVLGAGIQEYFTEGSTFCGIKHGGRIETSPESFNFTHNALRALKQLQDKKLPVTMRGDFTWRAAKRAGFEYGISLGCPSLMLNPAPNAGELLAKKYDALKKRIGDRTLKIAINVKNECNGFPKIFEKILQDYPNAVVFAQHKNEALDLPKIGVLDNRVRGFIDVEEWQKAISDFDVSIGVRIHGNMLALSVGVPAFVIATDHRVLELVERMKLPYTTSFDEKLVAGLDVAKLVTSYPFDAKVFDQNRCETAQVYEGLLPRYGIPVSPHVKRIAASCSS